MITTKVRQLTGHNISALRRVEGIYITEGKTYVIFEGTPREALAAVERTMAAQGQRNGAYRSLEAVRRKLRNAATMDTDLTVAPVVQLTDYVQVSSR
jgi:hypothetical protein